MEIEFSPKINIDLGAAYNNMIAQSARREVLAKVIATIKEAPPRYWGEGEMRDVDGQASLLRAIDALFPDDYAAVEGK